MPNGRTEADTCRTLITPKLQAAGWEKRLQAETAAELAALLPAILGRAFNGEL